MSDEIPLSNVMAAAVMMHEMYTACIEVGFTAEQALKIVLAIATSLGSGRPSS